MGQDVFGENIWLGNSISMKKVKWAIIRYRLIRFKNPTRICLGRNVQIGGVWGEMFEDLVMRRYQFIKDVIPSDKNKTVAR